MDIYALKVCEKHNVPPHKKATWSKCLLWALESIDEDIILYMQEDYFLKDFVKNNIVNKYVELMNDNQAIHCIQLTPPSVKAKEKSIYENLYTVDHNYFSVVSCQASLWRKDILIQYIRTYENAWQFEWWGSKRANYLPNNFYVIDTNQIILDENEIIPYIFTGIIGGKWYTPTKDLFSKHNIEIDYSIRGFYKKKESTFMGKLKYKTKNFPIEIRGRIDLWKLKNK